MTPIESLQQSVDAEGGKARGDSSREKRRPAEATCLPHEGAEQDADGISRRSDDKLEELEPDDFVDEGAAAGADE